MQALDIDGSLAEAHTSLGLVKEHFDWDWTGAEREFQARHRAQPELSDRPSLVWRLSLEHGSS